MSTDYDEYFEELPNDWLRQRLTFGYGHDDGYNWVWPESSSKRTKEKYPYSYDLHYVRGNAKSHKDSTDGVYSDRIFQWDREKAQRCWKEHVGNHNWNSAPSKNLEAFLRAFFDKPDLEMLALAEGCNVGNGYPYWFVWFKHQ